VRTLCGARVGVRAAQVDPLKDLVSLKFESPLIHGSSFTFRRAVKKKRDFQCLIVGIACSYERQPNHCSRSGN